MQVEEAVVFERDIRTLHDLFYEMRFWEKSVLLRRQPNADKKFGIIIEQFRKRILKISNMQPQASINEKINLILQSLARYEEAFNQNVQYKTDQRLNRTRIDTAYQSLTSNVLRSNQTSLLKPLFNLTHFLTTYRIDTRKSEYQALLLVVDYIESKLLQARLIDPRMQGYIYNFKGLLVKDFELEEKMNSIDQGFDVITVHLMDLMENISREAQDILKLKLLETGKSREKLNKIFLVSSTLSIAVFLFILLIIAREIIYPIRSMANVMKEVENKNILSRFEYHGNKKDEIVQLGLAFNEMLDTIQTNNEALLSYQNALEKKVFQLAASEKELKGHREHLERIVQHRTSDLTVANTLLTKSLKEKDSLLKEIHHRVKNNLQIISSLLKFQANQTRDEQSAALFKDSQDRITSMALIHQQLYESKDLSSIDFGLYIKNLLNCLMRSYKQKSRTIRAEIDIDNITLGIDVAIPCGLIVNELVTNALKYAFPADEGGLIFITAQWADKDSIELLIGDNGIGMPENFDIRTAETFGLQLITGLVEHQLTGKIEFTRNIGTQIRIIFKNFSGKARI
ncbi:histidine kinase dimerization/phosphoacceptor domain -containing protein [Desulfocicer vacuolatum]|nr:histidine kinase dimerization/phosphoacceptor domain -containing protein [Desulfocicer vacuolatum]